MTAQTTIQLPEKVDDLVAMYVKLRDKIKEADDAHKKKLEPAKTLLEAINGKLLERLNATGGDSIKTPNGTAYRTERKSATIADGDAFRQYVIDNQHFDLVDWRANAVAVSDFINDHGAQPPGINYSVAFTVGVRRS